MGKVMVHLNVQHKKKTDPIYRSERMFKSIRFVEGTNKKPTHIGMHIRITHTYAHTHMLYDKPFVRKCI